MKVESLNNNKGKLPEVLLVSECLVCTCTNDSSHPTGQSNGYGSHDWDCTSSCSSPPSLLARPSPLHPLHPLRYRQPVERTQSKVSPSDCMLPPPTSHINSCLLVQSLQMVYISDLLFIWEGHLDRFKF